jgi:hypothetical protein
MNARYAAPSNDDATNLIVAPTVRFAIAGGGATFFRAELTTV